MWLICRFVCSSLLCCLLSNLPEKCKESYPIAVCLCACVCTHACLCTAHTDFSFSWSPCTVRAFHFFFLPQRGQAVQPSSPTLHWWTNLLVANSTGTELSFKDGHSAGLRCPRVPLSWLSLIWEAPALLCGCHEARAHITALLPSTPTIHRLRCPSAIRGVWRIEMLTSQKRTAESSETGISQTLARMHYLQRWLRYRPAQEVWAGTWDATSPACSHMMPRLSGKSPSRERRFCMVLLWEALLFRISLEFWDLKSDKLWTLCIFTREIAFIPPIKGLIFIKWKKNKRRESTFMNVKFQDDCGWCDLGWTYKEPANSPLMICVFLNLVLWMQFIFKEIHGLSKPELAMWGRWQKEHHHKTCHLSVREEGSSQD